MERQYIRNMDRKRLILKLLKHFLANKEYFYAHPRMDGTTLGIQQWNQYQRKVAQVTQKSRGNWDEDLRTYIEASLRTEEHAELYGELLALGHEWYESCMERAIFEALEDSDTCVGIQHGNKAYAFVRPSVHFHHGKRVRSDLFVSRSGLCVFLRPKKSNSPSREYFDPNEGFLKRVRTAYTKKSFNRKNMIQFDMIRTSYVLSQPLLDLEEDE